VVTEAVAGAATTSPRHRFLVCAAGPVPVEIDRERLALAMDALLENAARYQSGGGTVRIFVSADDATATVEIQDFGVGIRPERLGYVFEPLFEPWPPGSPHYVGVVGMGLHLARRIVEAHGGTIEAESHLGEGSVFRFRIPRRIGSRPTPGPTTEPPRYPVLPPLGWEAPGGEPPGAGA
jgi:signal transduction histidine kinase